MNNNRNKTVVCLLIIAVVMIVLMSVYEALKQYLFPAISLWESHIITICFSTVSATIAGFFILRKQITINDALAQKITESEHLRGELESSVSQLTETLSEVKTLSGMLPICASCKKIRDDKGYWNQIESYIKERTRVDFSHGLCPDCILKLYPDHVPKKGEKP